MAEQKSDSEVEFIQANLFAKLATTIEIFKRSAIFLCAWVLLIVGGSATVLFLTPSMFSAETSVLLDAHPRNSSVSGDPRSTPGNSIDSAQADSQIQVIKSERLLRSVFSQLDLQDNKEFVPGRFSIFSLLRRSVSFGATLFGTKEAEVARDEASFVEFMSRISARRVGQSYVIEISFLASQPSIAAKLANSIAMQYIRQQVSANAAAAQNGTEYLQGRISRIQNELSLAAAAVSSGSVPDSEFPDADAKVISAAIDSLTRAYPQRRLLVFFSVVISILSGAMIVIIRGGLSRRIYNQYQVESLLTGRNRFPVHYFRLPRARGMSGLKQLHSMNWRDASLIHAESCLRDVSNYISFTRSFGVNYSVSIVSCSSSNAKAKRECVINIFADVVMDDGAEMFLVKDAKSEDFPLTSMDDRLIRQVGKLSDPTQRTGIRLFRESGVVIYAPEAAVFDGELRTYMGVFDGVILVVAGGEDKIDTLQYCIDMIESARIELFGVVVVG